LEDWAEQGIGSVSVGSSAWIKNPPAQHAIFIAHRGVSSEF
jgi:hypothetical protein